MQEDEKAPEPSVDEQQEELELEAKPETPTEELPTEPQSDPQEDRVKTLEEELEKERAEKTKFKNIVERHRNKPEEPEPQEPQVPQGDFLTKEDFYKSNERKAINALTKVSPNDSDDVKASKQYIVENWNHISTLYQPRSGKDTPEDIMEDINDATTLFRAKNPTQPENNSHELAQTSGGGQGSSAPQAPATVDPPRFKQPTPPKEWYKLTPEQEQRLKDRGIL
jgi:hypothetical protein